MAIVNDPNNEAAATVAPAAAANDKITIRVVERNSELVFKLKMSFKMGLLMETYATRVSKDVHLLKFLLDGRRIEKSDTPISLGMEDNDEIQVFMEQTGGNSS